MLKKHAGKLTLLLFCIPQHVLLPTATSPSTLPLSLFSPWSLLSLLIPQSQAHTFASVWGGLGLSLLWQTFIPCHRPSLSVQSLYSSSAVLLTSPRTSPFSSSFQFPLLKWDVVYRGECVHSLSPAPVWVLGGGNGPVMKQTVLLCKHTPARFVGFFLCVCMYLPICVYACARTCTFKRVVD